MVPRGNLPLARNHPVRERYDLNPFPRGDAQRSGGSLVLPISPSGASSPRQKKNVVREKLQEPPSLGYRAENGGNLASLVKPFSREYTKTKEGMVRVLDS